MLGIFGALTFSNVLKVVNDTERCSCSKKSGNPQGGKEAPTS